MGTKGHFRELVAEMVAADLKLLNVTIWFQTPDTGSIITPIDL